MLTQLRTYTKPMDGRWFRWAVFLFMPFAVLLGAEYILRQSLTDAAAWIVSQPVEFLINFLLHSVIVYLVVGVVGHLYIGLILGSLVVLLFSFINFYKTQYLGEPLFPSDLLLSQQGSDLMPYLYNGLGSQNLIAVLVLLVGIAVLWTVFPRVRMRRMASALAGIAALCCVLAVYLFPTALTDGFNKIGVEHPYYDQAEGYRQNGLLLGFTFNLGFMKIEEPAGYSEEAVQALLDQADQTSDPVADVKNPNVIIVMSEAFWDPTRMTNLTFSEDPMPNLRRLQKEFTSGSLVSPVIGGGTSNVEFEALTGNSMAFLPYGSMPYQQYVTGELPSLAAAYADKGYKSVAVHSYHKWFWNRDTVYKYLGFERFISQTEMPQPLYKGPFIDDAEMTKHIIRQVDNADRPVFVYAVTMQNHGPYTTPRYDRNAIRVTGDLPPDTRQALETYAQGIKDADAQLQQLIDHYSQTKTPTVIVFFGDHLPLLDPVYEEAGYAGPRSSWTAEDTLKMHSTPLLVWNNYGLEREELVTSPSFLAPYLLKITGMERTPHMRFVERVGQQFPVLQPGLAMDAEGRPRKVESLGELGEAVREYEMIQYDLMFGKRYGGDAYATP